MCPSDGAIESSWDVKPRGQQAGTRDHTGVFLHLTCTELSFIAQFQIRQNKEGGGFFPSIGVGEVKQTRGFCCFQIR